METSLLIYSANELTGFFKVGTLGLKNVTKIKSANWFLIDFLSNVKVFYIILLTVYEIYQVLTWHLVEWILVV